MTNNIDILDFLLSNDCVLHYPNSDRSMTADMVDKMSGEFVVYERFSEEDLYRGTDFQKALRVLNGTED